MTITGAIVLYSVIWFLTLYMLLSIGMKSQGDVGEVVPGTPASAPVNPRIKRKLIQTTIITTILWVIVVATIMYSGLTIHQFDFFSPIDPTHPYGTE